MQDDSNMQFSPVQQEPMPASQPQPQIPVSVAPPAAQNTLEYAMFGFAIATILSFLLNNGVLLKLGLIAAMVVAIVSILRNYSNAKTAVPVAPLNIESANQAAAEQAAQASRKRSFKIIGFVLLAVILLPVLGYGLMIAAFILMLMLGGGNMGT